MKEYQQRVIEEKEQLDYKIQKLDEFFLTAIYQALPFEEQDRMRRQIFLMRGYSSVLGERIAAF